MTKEEVLTILKECAEIDDEEESHIKADDALILYINDPDITDAYEALIKYYS